MDTDKLLEKFFAFVDHSIGMENVLVVLTADHGVAPVPEVNTARKMPGGRVSLKSVQDAVQDGDSARNMARANGSSAMPSWRFISIWNLIAAEEPGLGPK